MIYQYLYLFSLICEQVALHNNYFFTFPQDFIKIAIEHSKSKLSFNISALVFVYIDRGTLVKSFWK